MRALIGLVVVLSLFAGGCCCCLHDTCDCCQDACTGCSMYSGYYTPPAAAPAKPEEIKKLPAPKDAAPAPKAGDEE